MNLIKNKYTVILVILVLAGLVFCGLYFTTDTPTPDEPQTLVPECPGEEFVYRAGITWSEDFHEKHPDATVEEQVADWNSLLRKMKCDEYQVSTDEVRYSGVLSDLMNSTSTGQVKCRTHDEMSAVFEQWFTFFVKTNPEGTDAALMEGWDELMMQNGCTELVDPFDGQLPPQ